MGSSRHTDPPIDQVERTLGSAAHAAARGDEPLVERCLARLGHVAGAQPSLIARVLQAFTDRLLGAAWEHGWQPYDLTEYARRRLPATHQAYLVDAIAAEHRRYPAASTHPHWRGQLDDLGAEVWWQPERYLLPQWADRHRLARLAAVKVAVTVTGFLIGLPRLPRLLPPPGSAPSTAEPVSDRTPDAKLLARIRALLAKAEATEFPEEAEALSSKAQQLMARFSLDRALVDAGPLMDGALVDGAPVDGGQGPTGHRIWVDGPYVSAKTHLVQAVAAANRCRAISSDRLGFVTVLGAELDLRLVELLATSLLVQADRAMLASAPDGTPIRSYRRAFLLSYAERIGERLRQVARRTQETVERSAADRLRPVLASRERAVDALLVELFPNLVTRRVSVSNAAGWAAGRTAADLANLDTASPLPSTRGRRNRTRLDGSPEIDRG